MADDAPPQAARARPLLSHMSKKRYNAIAASLESSSDESGKVTVDVALATIRSVLNFDPEDRTFMLYTKAQHEKMAQRRGVSVYVASGRKAYDDRKRGAKKGL